RLRFFQRRQPSRLPRPKFLPHVGPASAERCPKATPPGILGIVFWTAIEPSQPSGGAERSPSTRNEREMDRRLANERRAAIACRIEFERLVAESNAGGSELMRRVLGLVSLWERQESCSPYYWERWRQLLAMPLEEAEAIILADT